MPLHFRPVAPQRPLHWLSGAKGVRLIVTKGGHMPYLRDLGRELMRGAAGKFIEGR